MQRNDPITGQIRVFDNIRRNIRLSDILAQRIVETVHTLHKDLIADGAGIKNDSQSIKAESSCPSV